MIADNKRAFEMYRNDRMFRGLVQAIVHTTITERGSLDPEKVEREVYEVATDVCAKLLETIYTNDAGLSQMRYERDIYKKMAESMIGYLPPHPFIVRVKETDAVVADTHP